MLRCASPRFSSLNGLKSPRFTRHFHRVTTNFVDYDPSGNLDPKKVSIIVGDPGETYVLIDPGVGTAIRAALSRVDFLRLMVLEIDANLHSSTIRSILDLVGDLGIKPPGLSSYPRLYVPSQMPRQTESNSSPATLFLSGKMHEIVLDGTPDGKDHDQPTDVSRILKHHIYLAKFAENAKASVQSLEPILRQLKDM
ncbi:hypothetical protein N7528_001878 [Penicillium herquei]|nr:hypothetical protein N7528_001878 [Penicillium herquei]